ncbi:MAG: hypothetical protein IJP64_03040 [Oscillospiraceae bacterium]|nr:hypothetical protein [Oscillospiraceae bacterium]
MRIILCIAALSCLLVVPVFAAGEGLDVSAVEDALPDDAREVSGSLMTDGSYDVHGAIGRLIDKAKTNLNREIRGEIKELARIAAIAVVCTAAEAVCTDGRMEQIISLCACSAVVLLAAGSIDSMTEQLTEAIRMLCDYARAALPAVYTASAVSGAVVSAGAKYAAVSLSMSIMMDVLQRLTVPLIYAYLAVCICRCVSQNALLGAASSVIKWVCVTAMTVLTMGVSAYITLTGALTGGADAVAVKGTRTLIAGTLPVVGGILSDAASVVLASASVIKSSAGVFALIGVCALCLGPFVAIGVKMLLFRLCAAVASAMEGKRLAALLGDLSGALGMMMGVLGTLTIMLFIAFTAAIRTVNG